MRIHDVLRGKPSPEVVTISSSASVRELLALLARHNVGALIVSDDGSSVDGIVSERDVVRRLVEDEGVLAQPVATIMTAEVHTCEPSTALNDLMALMTEQRVRHVPVLSEGRLTGIVSIGDVVKHRIGELEFERAQLDSYIQS